MYEEPGEEGQLARLARSLVGAAEVDRELEQAVLAELRREGRITYMGARRRRLARERAVAALHERG